MRLALFSVFATTLAFISALSIQNRDNRKRAAYTLSNNAAGANLLALSISVEDGTLSKPVLTPTGGKGLLGNTANGTSGPDGLFGQGAVTVSQDYLFTVNPGSNTLSMFHISKDDLLHPKLVGKPVSTLGSFPMSVAYSASLKTACVLNGGSKAGVACFHVDHRQGLTRLGGLRHLPLNQTTPPLGPPLTTSDISFNPSSTALFATVKGNAMASPPAIGSIYAFPVKNGWVAHKPVVNQIKDLPMDFSIDFLGSDTSALITDPSFGGSIVTIAYPSLEITENHHIAVANQGAACWGAYSSRFDAAYIIDAAHPNITAIDPVSGQTKGVIEYGMAAKGGFDTAIDRTWMYVLSGASTVVVIDLDGSHGGKAVGKQVQSFDLAAEGPAGAWQGMAIYPS